jgi:conjugative relaxase-like TrwC/TraI family protein
MLLTWDVTSATDAKNYYSSCFSPDGKSSRQDYYSEGQESPGRFGGKLGERLGLAGKVVDKETFDRLCDNLHPANDEPLTPRTNEKRRVCKDLTFSGPKSFSIIEAFASEDERRRLRHAFDEVINETMDQDIEPDMQTRVRIGGADYDRTTGNVLTAGFDHLTARPKDGQSIPDPHLHRHLLVWNATHDPVEDRIKAGQLGNVVRDKGYYQAAFFSRLACKVEGMGYVIDRRSGGTWEIAGVPQTTIDKFSKRTAQIEAAAEELGITDAARKAELGAKVRSKKQKDLTLPELRKAWDAQLTDAERRALATVYRKEVLAGEQVTPAEAVAFAIAHCSEQESVVPERELKRVALLRGLGSVTPGQIAAELPRHGVITAEIDGRLMATTQELQAEERFLSGFAAGGRGTVCPVGVPAGLDRTLADGKRLNDGQWDTVTGLLTSENRVNLFEGPAGAGKSYSLQKFDEGMRRAGKSVTYLATTTDAVGVLEKDGFEVNTVARFLKDTKMQQAAKGGRVVVDEVSMLGHKDAVAFFKLAEELNLKLILVGDPMQHGSVGRGALMRVLKEYGGIQPFRLTEIMRQEKPEYRAAAKLLSEGKTLEGFDALDRLEWIKELGGDQDRYRQIAADYLDALKDKKSVLVVSPTHAEAAKVTQAIRSDLRDAGKLGKEERTFTRLVAVGDVSEAMRGLATTYRPGDVIQFHQNAKGGFKKGDRLIVTDPAKVPLSEAEHFQLYRPDVIALSVGDKIRGTGTVKTLDGHKFRNGSTGTVTGFTKAGDIKLDNGWVLPKDAGHFRSGFVETSFGSQGRTVKRVILAVAETSLPVTNQQQMYVGASRAVERMTLYTDNKAAVRAAVPRTSLKKAALDLLPKQHKASDQTRKANKQRQRRLSLIDRVRAAWDAPPPRQNQPERQAERQVSYGR